MGGTRRSSGSGHTPGETRRSRAAGCPTRWASRSGSRPGAPLTLALVNPLPIALAHYAAEIDAVIRSAGYDTDVLSTPSAELADGGSLVGRSLRTLRWRISTR